MTDRTLKVALAGAVDGFEGQGDAGRHEPSQQLLEPADRGVDVDDAGLAPLLEGVADRPVRDGEHDRRFERSAERRASPVVEEPELAEQAGRDRETFLARWGRLPH